MNFFNTTLSLNKSKTIKIVITIFCVLAILFSITFGIPLMRKPRFFDGNIFDKQVSKTFYLDWFEKHPDAKEENFTSAYKKDLGLIEYSYVFYTDTALGDSYINLLKTNLTSLHGQKLLVGSLSDLNFLGEGFSVDGEGNITFVKSSQKENDTTYQSVSYNVVYTKIVKRKKSKIYFLKKVIFAPNALGVSK